MCRVELSRTEPCSGNETVITCSYAVTSQISLQKDYFCTWVVFNKHNLTSLTVIFQSSKSAPVWPKYFNFFVLCLVTLASMQTTDCWSWIVVGKTGTVKCRSLSMFCLVWKIQIPTSQVWPFIFLWVKWHSFLFVLAFHCKKMCRGLLFWVYCYLLPFMLNTKATSVADNKLRVVFVWYVQAGYCAVGGSAALWI